MPSPAKVYSKELESQDFGYPLWLSEPTKFGEVEIGDVGFVQDGGFYRLFNATRSAHDHVNSARGVPDGFTVLEYDEYALLHRLEGFLKPGPIVSKSSRQAEVTGGVASHGVETCYEFSFEKEQGTVAVLGDHATRCLVNDNDKFQKYMLRNKDSWLSFARSQGYVLKADDIVLVSGWVKTSAWALATCTGSARGHKLSIRAGVDQLATAQFGVRFAEGSKHSVVHRSGPYGRCGTNQPRDQCLFLRFTKSKKRLPGVKKALTRMKDAVLHLSGSEESAHPSQDASRATCRINAVELGQEPEEDMQYSAHSAVDDLLDYILENSNADIAIAGHYDLHEICGDEWDDNLPSYLRRLSLRIDVDVGGVGRVHHGQSVLTLDTDTHREDDTSHRPPSLEVQQKRRDIAAPKLRTAPAGPAPRIPEPNLDRPHPPFADVKSVTSEKNRSNGSRKKTPLADQSEERYQAEFREAFEHLSPGGTLDRHGSAYSSGRPSYSYSSDLLRRTRPASPLPHKPSGPPMTISSSIGKHAPQFRLNQHPIKRIDPDYQFER